MFKKKLNLIAYALTFFVLTYIHIYSKTTTKPLSPKPATKPTISRPKTQYYFNVYNTSHAEYCKERSEWIRVSENVYSKIDFHFYFIDEAKFRGFIVCKNGYLESIGLKLDIFNRDKFIMSYETDLIINPPWFVDEYGHTSTYADFDLNKVLNGTYSLNEDISARVYYLNKHTNKYTKKYANLKIKYLRPRSEAEYQSRKSALLCSKALYLAKNQYKELSWWIEINKKIGYDSMTFYNNSIPNTVEFNRVFSQNQDFVTLLQLKCLPNFLNRKSEYLEFYEELTYSLKMDVFNGLLVNECYLENIDKYKYIAVMDNDETVIPGRIEEIDTSSKYVKFMTNMNTESKKNPINSLKCDKGLNESSTRFDKFIDNIVNASNINEPISYNFDQGFFLKYKLVDILFEKMLNMKLFERLNKKDTDFNAIVHIKNLTYAEFDPNQEGFNIIINFTKKDELQYAYNMFSVYKSYVKPFLKKYKAVIRKYCDKFDRIVKLLESQDHVNMGKTIHNTKTTLFLTVHEPLYSKSKKIPLEYAHLSHFRSHYQVTEKDPLPIPITQIQIDFSYFKCYFKPIIRSMIKMEKIF